MKNKQPHEPVDVRTAVNGSALSDKWFPDGSQTKNEVLPKSTGTKCLVQKTSGTDSVCLTIVLVIPRNLMGVFLYSIARKFTIFSVYAYMKVSGFILSLKKSIDDYTKDSKPGAV